jgi:hypothetical protein
MCVTAWAVPAPMKSCGMPTWVARLPAPVSEFTHCARSGLTPLAVLMLPLATIGSSRLLPATDVYVGLARHCQTGIFVSADAAGAAISTPAPVTSTTRTLRIMRLPSLWPAPTTSDASLYLY